ncbi:MAG: type II toxin-antitoxin system RelE/ParE family toxin [Spirulina sp.]
MKRYIITLSASRDLTEITNYFASRNIDKGEELLATFNKKCKQLIKFPQMGRSYEEVRPNLRGLPLNGYIILYQITEDLLEILRVVHGSRDLENLFESDEDIS